MTSSDDRHFGLTGLATMGANLARNVAHHDIPVAVHNRTTSRMTAFVEEHGSEGPIEGFETTQEWVGALRTAPGADEHGAGGPGHRRRHR